MENFTGAAKMPPDPPKESFMPLASLTTPLHVDSQFLWF